MLCMLCERVDCESCAVNEDRRGLYHALHIAFVLLLSVLLTVFLLSLSVVDRRGQLSIKQSAALVHIYNLSMLLSEARVASYVLVDNMMCPRVWMARCVLMLMLCLEKKRTPYRCHCRRHASCILRDSMLCPHVDVVIENDKRGGEV